MTTAQELINKYGVKGSVPIASRDRWRDAVIAGHTDLSYFSWAAQDLNSRSSNGLRPATTQEIVDARMLFTDNDVAIDDDAQASEAEGHVWVSAWVRVEKE